MLHRFSTPFLLSLVAIGCTGTPDKSAEKTSVPAAQPKTAKSAATSTTPVEQPKTPAAPEKPAPPAEPAKVAKSTESAAAPAAQPKPTTDKEKAVKPTEQPKSASTAEKTAKSADSSLLALKTTSLDGKPVDLSMYKGKVALVVNVASECGYTPQYAGLEKLYEDLADRGFVVLGFPSNDFGGQEPGTPAQIQTFCHEKYDVRFPMFSKVETKAGADQSPVYAYLNAATGKLPSWNFCKYLIDKDGKAIAFYPSKVKPDDADLRKAIDTALAAK